MKALPVLLLALLAVGCHFDKLFSGSGGAAPRGSAAPPTATHLTFATQPSDAAPGTKITPPVQVAAVDDQDNIVTSFSGTISIDIEQDASLLRNAHLSGTTNDVSLVNGVATFPDLSIDQPGIGYTLVARNARPWSAASEPFNVGVP